MMSPAKQEQAFLNAVLENAGALVVVLDRDGRIRRFNRACEKLSGYRFAEVEGRYPWDTVLPPDEAESVRKGKIAALINNPQGSGTYANHWLAKNGARYLIEWTGSTLTDPSGEVEFIVFIGTDITQRESLARQLREKATIIDQIHDSVVATDLDGIVTSWNKGAERIFGYSAQEMLGQSIATVYPPEQIGFLHNQVIAPLKSKGTHEVDVVMQRKNGARFHGHLSLSMLVDADRRPIGMIGYTMDITAQREAEQRHRASEARMETILAASPVVIYSCEAWGQFAATYISPNVQRAFGYQPDQFLKDPGFWARNIHPDDSERVFRDLAELFVHEKHSHEYRFRMPDGAYRWVRDELRLLRDERGEPLEIVGSWTDISEHKQTETQLLVKNAAIASALSGIAITDLDANLVYVNPAFLKMWQFDQESDALEYHPTALVQNPDEISRIIEILQRQSAYQGKFVAKRRDGSTFPVEMAATLVCDAQGNATHMLGTFIDITAHVQSEAALRESEERLRLALSSASQGLYDLNVQTGEAVVSPEYALMLGYDPADFHETNAAWRQRLHPDDEAAVYQAYSDYIAGHRPDYRVEFRQRTKSGDWKWILSVGKVVSRDHEGRPLRMLGTHTDITDRIALESETRQMRDRLQFVLDASPDWIFAKDFDHRFIMVNKACANDMGLVPAQLVGKRDTDFWPLELCEGNPAKGIRGFHEDDRRAFAGELTRNPHDPATAGDGKHRIFDTIKGPLRNDRGEIIGVFSYARDITERVDAEERYQSVVAAMSEGVVIQQADGQIVGCNAAAENILGLTADQMRGRTAMDPRWRSVREDGTPFPGEDHPGTVALRTGQVFQEVVMGVDHPGKGRRWISINALPLKFASSDTPYGSVASFTDITERKAARDALLASNQLISAVLDTTPVLIAVLDTNMNFVRVNAAYARANQQSVEHFPGKNHFALFPNAENEAVFRRVVSTGISYSATAKPFEYTNNPSPGVNRWDWALTPIMTSDGRVSGLVLSLMNVTDRLQALEEVQRNERELKRLNDVLESRVAERTMELEEALGLNRQMIAVSPAAISAYAESGECLFANDAMADLIDATQQQVLNQNFRNIRSWRESGLLDQALRTLASGGTHIGEYHMTTTFGREIWCHCSTSRFTRNGKTHLLMVANDMTSRKKSEFALVQTKNEAERANAAKSDFLSRMSHELRTPLNAILGFAQVLELQTLTAENKECVDEINLAGHHLLNLINELLDLARIESGKLAVLIQPTQVHTVVSESIRITQPLIAQKNITLDNNCDSTAVVLADPTRLRQILVNLLSNATKYNRDAGSILVRCVEAPAGQLRISVTDTGSGIPAEKLPLLFQSFERLGAELGPQEGAGIGLALSKQLAELMNGSVGVESNPGHGSTFWVALPLAQAALEYEDAAPATPATNADNFTVLCVEDNTANLRLVEAIFRIHPRLRLLTANNAKLGLELAQHERPDVILLDIHLPDRDGFAVLRELNSDPATQMIPVIALSADAMPADIERGLQAGFVRYLTKPLIVNQLMATLEDVLATRSTAPTN